MRSQTQRAALRKPQTLGVTSPAFTNGKPIPREFTRYGSNENPPLRITGVPREAQALALVVDDPDAPGGTFTHWTAWNLPADLKEVPQLARVGGAWGGEEGRTDFGKTGYGGPDPPSGTHRYFFRVFALDKRLTLPANSTVEEVWRALDAHTLAWGELMGTFTRP